MKMTALMTGNSYNDSQKHIFRMNPILSLNARTAIEGTELPTILCSKKTILNGMKSFVAFHRLVNIFVLIFSAIRYNVCNAS